MRHLLLVPFCCSETWILLKAPMSAVCRHSTIHMPSQQRILRVYRFDHITKGCTSLEDIEPKLGIGDSLSFVTWPAMQPGDPAHDTLWNALEIRCHNAPDTN